jgi:hypothetical protein
MKKNTILKLFIVLGFGILNFQSKAQITITSANMPSVNDTIRYSSTLAYPGFNESATGANYHWDFSDIGIDTQGIDEYKSALQTPYIFNFAGAMGLKIADSIGQGDFKMTNVYSFYQKSTAQYTARGFGFSINVSGFPVPQSGEYTTLDRIYQFPLNYNDSASNPFFLNIKLGIPFVADIGSYIREGIRTNIVDGWGTITTPYAADVPCLRVKSIITGKDSIRITMPSEFATSFPVNEVEYKWLSLTEKIPMLEIRGTVFMGNFVPTFIKYRDKNRGMASNPQAPVVDFTFNKGFGYQNIDTFKFTGLVSGNPTSLQWSFNPSSGVNYVNGTNALSLNPQVVFTNPGFYTPTLSASNTSGTGTESKINSIEIIALTSIEELNAFYFKIFPNPVEDNVSIILENNKEASCLVEIFDTKGRLVNQFQLSNSDNIISLKHLNSGLYYIKILNQNKNILIKKPIIKI